MELFLQCGEGNGAEKSAGIARVTSRGGSCEWKVSVPEMDEIKGIRICEKPESISYDDIHLLLFNAHEKNRKEKRFSVNYANLSGEELKKLVGENGKTWVALDGNKLVGTASYRIVDRRYWCVSDTVADRMLLGVLPEYHDRHIGSRLFETLEKDVREAGLHYIETLTAEANDTMQHICLREGYHFISFSAPKSDHYNVVMLKWLETCPVPLWQLKLRYAMRKYYIKFRFKPGRIKRFGI